MPAMLPSLVGLNNINEDDDDFGDFVFSSPSSSSHPTSLFAYPTHTLLPAAATADDEDWGDFFASPLRSQSIQPQSSSPLAHAFDPSPPSSKAWDKPNGAIPLSIFCEEEAGEPLEGSGVFENGFGSYYLSSRSSPRVAPGGKLNDLIESLYGQAGSGGKEEKDEFDEGSWEFKDAFSADARPKMDEGYGAIFGLDMIETGKENARSQVVVNRLGNGWKGMEQFSMNSQEIAEQEELTNRSLGQDHSVTDESLHEMLPSFGNGTLSIGTDESKIEFPENAIRNGSTEKIQEDQTLLHPPGKKEAEKDLNAAVELFKHSSVLQILRLASKEQQLFYINAWSKLASACAQELQLGAKIWTESLDCNISKQLLTKGNKYFISLGEIYRVSKILNATVKVYMPWLLSNLKDSSEIVTCLDRCNEAWINSCFEALQSISRNKDLDDKGSAKSLSESINLIDKVFEPIFQDPVFHHGVCKFSLLPLNKLPEIKTVVWNGDWYISKVAIFWANRISPDPPELPSIIPS